MRLIHNSWGVGGYCSECCCDGVREGVGGASVAGFEGVPGFEVGDDLFDPPPDLVDGPVDVLVGLGEGKPREFGGGGDKSQPDIPFVRDVPGGRVSGRVVVRGVVVVVEEA